MLGERWTDEPLPDDEHLSPAHAEARKAAYQAGMKRMGGAKASPTYSQQDAWDLSELLASNGTEGLPPHSHIETTSVDTTTPLQKPYGKVYTTVATSVTIWPLEPMTPAGCLLLNLLDRSGRLNQVTYERMVKETPGVVEGRLIGPRDVMFARQEAARAKYPRLWHN
jgi:hypothetical protein